MTESNPDDAGAVSPSARLAAVQSELKVEARGLAKLATILGPLTKPANHAEIAKLEKAIVAAKKKVVTLQPEGVRRRGEAAMVECEEALADRIRRVRESLARELRQACDAAGLEMQVISREDPVELRIPPFAVVIDREKGSAELRFARLAIATCPATAEDIVKTHATCRREFEGKFDPAGFFAACHRAWRAARASQSSDLGDRVEILDFLPQLALQLQRPAFNVEPNEKNYQGYSRARFAFDVLRLRRQGMLAHDGKRLNLGVATGTSASKKKRVIWFEDEMGHGEFKLTVYFTQAEGRA